MILRAPSISRPSPPAFWSLRFSQRSATGWFAWRCFPCRADCRATPSICVTWVQHVPRQGRNASLENWMLLVQSAVRTPQPGCYCATHAHGVALQRVSDLGRPPVGAGVEDGGSSASRRSSSASALETGDRQPRREARSGARSLECQKCRLTLEFRAHIAKASLAMPDGQHEVLAADVQLAINKVIAMSLDGAAPRNRVLPLSFRRCEAAIGVLNGEFMQVEFPASCSTAMRRRAQTGQPRQRRRWLRCSQKSLIATSIGV